jgi:hypothetical protein
MLNALLIFLLFFIMPTCVFANPVISEFMADNKSTIADEDGNFSDWIEIHNPTSTAINLLDWALTDRTANMTQWKFPSVTLAPGEFLLVWASSKDRRVVGAPLHTNFALSKAGEYLALVRPDGVTIQQEFSPQFPAQGTDASFGARFSSTTLLPHGANGKYAMPTGASAPSPTWNQPSFDDSSWTNGVSGFGFGIATPGMTVRQVSKNGGIEGLNDALNLISLPASDPLVLNSTTAVMKTLNLLGEGSDGNYGLNENPPGGGGENYAIVATGTLTIPNAGAYTFGLNSDDGGQIIINKTQVMRDDSFHGPENRFGTITLSAGTHTFQVIMFEGGGGDCVEFFAAPGKLTSFDGSAFRLVGDVENGGLATTTIPQGASEFIATDLASEMSASRGAYIRQPFEFIDQGNATSCSLVIRYSDGFTAWLNGTQVAASNAPLKPAWNSLATSSRSIRETIQRSGFNLTAEIPNLIHGTNLMAIHGMKSSISDTSFLVLPEIIIGRLNSTTEPVIYADELATPGWINGSPSSFGFVADVICSTDRGFYKTPVQIALTTPTVDAVIRYTTDGSTPTETNGSIYTTPFTISSTTVLRAVATLDGWKPSNVITQTYLFTDDIITQSANGATPTGWPQSSGTNQILKFGMDPRIVNHTNPNIGGQEQVISALHSLPSVCLTTDLPNLFNMEGSQGIYSNPYQRGFAWERPVSVEWINPPTGESPNGSGQFQINAGLRIRGGYSRSEDNPKHALRLFFRQEYGASKLQYPIFGNEAASEFDKIDLRTAQNYSWSFEGGDQNTFLREESSRQAQIDMGQPGSHVRYFHLYLNGQYWGLHNFDERKDAAFAETYLGGKKEDYDVVKSESDNGYTVGATDGNLMAWQDLWNKGKAHRASPTNTNYFRMQGLSSNGVTPTADPVLLDPDNLIDYLLVTFWTGNFDGCVSAFLGNERGNNWFGCRSRDKDARQGFRFFVHDFEHSMFDVNEDRIGPFNSASERQFVYSNPFFLHQDLSANQEYRMRWADRIHKHLFNNGALTPSAWSNRVNRFSSIVDQAIIAESARWGSSKTSEPRTKEDWVNAKNAILHYIAPRHPVVLSQLRARGLYPSLNAPVLIPSGGNVRQGTEIAITAPNESTIYYMPDGSDPRAVGGALRSGALTYKSNTTSETLLPLSASEWKFLATGENLGNSWRLQNFDDASWQIGNAESGYGDGDEATEIPVYDINPSTAGIQRPATCYFRRQFDVSDVENITSLLATIKYDDGYSLYLNGTRVAGNLPDNVAHDFYTGTAIEDTIESVNLPASLLVNGRNTLAIEIHQANESSSDLSMNCSLDAIRSFTSTPVTLSNTGKRTIRFRAKNGPIWSALAESTYQIQPTPPKLQVEHPENTILIDQSSHLDFGATEIGTFVTKTITLRNVDTNDLTGLQVNLLGVHRSDYILSTLRTTTLSPGATTSFTVTLNPTSFGSINAALKITSQETIEKPIDIALIGNSITSDPFSFCFLGNPFPLRIGNSVMFDLKRLTNQGEGIRVSGTIPYGLKFDPVTMRLSGTLTGRPRSYQFIVQVLQGKKIVRSIPFPISILEFPTSLIGSYDFILEDSDSLPTGVLRLNITSPNQWSASLSMKGSSRARGARGGFLLAEGNPVAPITANFAANLGMPPVAINIAIDGTLLNQMGSYNDGNLRGFRHARPAEAPSATIAYGIIINPGTQDGHHIPAGFGWLRGRVSNQGIGTFVGLLGDGTNVTTSLRVSPTGQAVLWMQPYANKNSFIGGIITLSDLNQPITNATLLHSNVWWRKEADGKTLSYPSGFPAIPVTIGSAKWTIPDSATALGSSLGWKNQRQSQLTIAGGGLNNSEPQSTIASLTTELSIDDKFGLLSFAPSDVPLIPWVGRVSKADGSFRGTFRIPSGFSSNIPAGTASASGLLLQGDSWGDITGLGTILVPTIGPKGSFKTSSMILRHKANN